MVRQALLNALLVAAACVGLARTLRHRCGAAVAVIVVASFLCLSDVLFIWRTSTHSLSLVILAAALGSGFNFIDFLVNPPMMSMLIAFFVLVDDRADAGALALAAVIAWFGG